jgi:hypothetical protein
LNQWAAPKGVALFPEYTIMTKPLENGYDATRDPRTGRPVLPLDAENARKAEVESQPLSDDDNQGIAIEEQDNPVDIPGIGEEDDLHLPISAEDEESSAASAEDINTTVPRMKGPDDEPEDCEGDLIDRNI